MGVKPSSAQRLDTEQHVTVLMAEVARPQLNIHLPCHVLGGLIILG